MKDLRKFLEENKCGGGRDKKGRILSLSNYFNKWYKWYVYEGRGEEEVLNDMRRRVEKLGIRREGNNLGVRLLDFLEMEGYKGEIVVERKMRKFSEKEVEWIGVSISEWKSWYLESLKEVEKGELVDEIEYYMEVCKLWDEILRIIKEGK